MATRDAVSDLIRGNIDAIILCVIADGDSYGYEILKDIAKKSLGAYEMKEPSLYTSLKRLERASYVEGYWGDETQGARRKYYRITEAGQKGLDESIERWVHVRDIIDRLLKRGEAMDRFAIADRKGEADKDRKKAADKGYKEIADKGCNEAADKSNENGGAR